MKQLVTVLSCLLIAGCVSGDCERRCYLFEITRVDRLTLQCEVTPFHPHCERLTLGR